MNMQAALLLLVAALLVANGPDGRLAQAQTVGRIETQREAARRQLEGLIFAAIEEGARPPLETPVLDRRVLEEVEPLLLLHKERRRPIAGLDRETAGRRWDRVGSLRWARELEGEPSELARARTSERKRRMSSQMPGQMGGQRQLLSLDQQLSAMESLSSLLDGDQARIYKPKIISTARGFGK